MCGSRVNVHSCFSLFVIVIVSHDITLYDKDHLTYPVLCFTMHGTMQRRSVCSTC